MASTPGFSDVVSVPFSVVAPAPGPWADVDGDAYVTIADAGLLQQYLGDAPLSDAQKERIRRGLRTAGFIHHRDTEATEI